MLIAFMTMAMKAYGNTPADSLTVSFRVGHSRMYPLLAINQRMPEYFETQVVNAVSENPDEPSLDPEFTDFEELIDLPDSVFFELEDFVELPDSISTEAEAMEMEIPHKSFHMALKTNMLFDALLIPNISAEFYLGSRMSVYGEWMYAWWDSYPRNRFWRTYGGDVGFRYWLGRKAKSRPLSGHHIGIYGGILTFDIELGGNGYMGGKPGGTLWDRFMVNTGIEYGFSMPVAKRLNIDFSIGIGYMGGRYIRYFPFDNDYYRDKEFQMHYWGPTKAEITLVWLLGTGCHKRKEVRNET